MLKKRKAAAAAAVRTDTPETSDQVTTAAIEGTEAAPPSTTPAQAATPKAARISTTAELKKLIFLNPKMSVDELIAKHAERHLKTTKSTVATIRADFFHTLKVLVELGALPTPVETK